MNNNNSNEYSLSEKGIDVIFWIGLKSTDKSDCISVIHDLTGETVFNEDSDNTFSYKGKCSQVLRKSIKSEVLNCPDDKN